MTAREALEAFAVAAAAYEDQKRAASEAQERKDQAAREAIDALEGAEIVMPVTAALPDGRAVTIYDVAEDYNYHLEYTVADAL